MYQIPEGIHLQDCKSVVESVRGEISGIIPYLLCELAVLNMLGTLNPTVKTLPFASWGVKILWGLLFLVPESKLYLEGIEVHSLVLLRSKV